MTAVGMPSAHPDGVAAPIAGVPIAGVRAEVESPRGLGERLAAFFGVGVDWVRPRPPIERRDLLLVLAVEAIGLLSLELVRSVGVLDKTTEPVWMQWLATSVGALLLLWRRRFPIVVALLAAAHMFIVGVTMPMVMGQMTLQVAYFIAFFSALAWASDRRLLVLVMSAIVLFMFGWLIWQFALGSGLQDILDEVNGKKRFGAFDPVVAGVALTFLVNVIFFAGAIASGQYAWHGARQRAQLVAQADLLADQSQALQRQAVIDERLRIARELHDVVGHHVSVIGVQAGAARRVLTKDPASAVGALSVIESSSREAVNQMRGLLGTLRDIEAVDRRTDGPTDPRASASAVASAGLAELPALIAEHRTAGLEVSYAVVEDVAGAAETLPGPVSLTIYRIAQEALANVNRHSTATKAGVVVRLTTQGSGAHAEVEILDAGRPRGGTSGSGLGQLGIRERAQSLGGLVEIGPRVAGGYRVRVRIPLGGQGGRSAV